jgi:hypothetical protein
MHWISENIPSQRIYQTNIVLAEQTDDVASHLSVPVCLLPGRTRTNGTGPRTGASCVLRFKATRTPQTRT